MELVTIEIRIDDESIEDIEMDSIPTAGVILYGERQSYICIDGERFQPGHIIADCTLGKIYKHE